MEIFGGETVRDVAQWIISLSEHAYELFPVEKRKRKQHTLDWMHEVVHMRSEQECDPFPGEQFHDVPALWEHYVMGYLFGRVAVGSICADDLAERRMHQNVHPEQNWKSKQQFEF